MEDKKWNFKGFGQPTLWVEGNFLKYKGANVPENSISLDLLTGIAMESKGNFFISTNKIVIYAGGTKAVEIPCASSNAKEVVEKISEFISNLKNNKSSNSFQSMGISSDIPSQIEKLAKLKEQGILTEAEFNKKKTELLEKM